MATWHESSMNSTEYKRYHESFMENNHGSTAAHTFFCIFFTVQCTLFNFAGKGTNGVVDFILEYSTIVLPLILAHTSLAPYITYLNFLSSICFIVQCFYLYPRLEIPKALQQPNTFQSKHIKSISCMRGLTYLITVFAILAVDFRAFPRHLAKTEKYGFSLMDTGVGLFVLMSGLVHRNLTKSNGKEIIKSNAKFITMLVTLGIVRFWSVKKLDYQEHITEYGVHWNFFFTLAVCKLSSTLLLAVSNKPLVISVITLVLHECLLINGLQDWVFSDTPRTDMLSANREGLCSCLGYTFLYIFAVYVKQEISNTTSKRLNVLIKLSAGSVFLWFLMNIVNDKRPASRTLANSSYCLFVCATLLTVVTILYLAEALHQEKRTEINFELPLVISAVNNNGLIFFLFANFLTGAINMSIRTLFVSDLSTFVILNFYMVTVIMLVVFLQKKGIKI